MENRQHIAPIGDEGLYILDTGSWRNFRPVIDQEKCSKCGLCFTFCPVNSISRVDNEYQISMSYCKGCGICANECPRKAIDMVPEGGKE
ncbi:Ferredoxin-type protein NapF [Sporomusa silvacetica DSM 10669]|uniref:Ferredoxin-type protein NapF n=1 Tax=Sporomusa silvacetica DSM 10669 TaxID=1123289 RepID=A0ABZ3IUZ3_9FIRM|nr:4Fe-4S binding protein [Sporomusa silvacetica]OZC14268.1 NADH-dependent phenylglyoxylate dehydrogenase subunit delta [Sporomusa silvacetica DSM 10669]